MGKRLLIAGILLTLAAQGLLALGAHECASGTIVLDTRVRTTSVVAQATAFDSFDRRSEGSAAIRFSSIRPKQTLVVIR